LWPSSDSTHDRIYRKPKNRSIQVHKALNNAMFPRALVSQKLKKKQKRMDKTTTTEYSVRITAEQFGIPPFLCIEMVVAGITVHCPAIPSRLI
jgi:hypothetical protein